MMQQNKPYLWVGKDLNGNLSLEIKADIPPTTNKFKAVTTQTVENDCLELSYQMDSQNGSTIFNTTVQYGYPTEIPPNSTPHFDARTHNRIRVLIKNSSGTTIGSCTREISYLNNNTPANVKPYVWLSSSKIYVQADNNIQLPTHPPAPDPISTNGSVRSITCNTGGSSSESTNWGDPATLFDPAVISQIKISIGAAGESTSNTGDADGSGGNDLLDDFFP